jgi:carbon monoxide dehydrogenase subunit G
MLALTAVFAVWLGAAANDSFHWKGQVQAGKLVEIRGINGSIRAEPASGKDVEVVAYKTGQVYESAGVEVRVVEHNGGVTICAMYPPVDGRPAECLPGVNSLRKATGNDVNVDFMVRLPKGVRFVGRTVNGQVEAKSLEADTEAHTVNGNVLLSTAGAGVGETVNGSITASVGKINSASKFSTVNGAITLEMAPGAAADVHAGTKNGHIHTDFPLEVRDEFVGGHADGVIGQGGPDLNIVTVNGTINLKRGHRIF